MNDNAMYMGIWFDVRGDCLTDTEADKIATALWNKEYGS